MRDRFQPGEGPSRGLLCDCTTSCGTDGSIFGTSPGAGGGSCNYIVEPMMVQGGSSPPPPHSSQLSGFLMILLKLSCQSTKFQQSPAAAQTIPAVVSPGIILAAALPRPRANQCYYAATPLVCGRTRSRCPAQPDPHHYHPITSISVSLYRDNVEIYLNIIVFRYPGWTHALLVFLVR